MPLIRKQLFFLYLLIPIGSLFGQNSNNETSLTEAFQAIETSFDCNFSYKDEDLSNHVVNLQNLTTLTATLEFLEKNTLFNYTLLADKTIAVKKKADLITVCATLVNGNTNLPFQNVAIRSPYEYFTTPSSGSFSLELLNLAQTVSFTYIGYQQVEVAGNTLTKRPCEIVLLYPKTEVLQKVVLRNYLAKGITKSQDGSVRINYSDFNILPGLIEPDVLQTIQALPGIQSVNETVSFINIRGGTNDQNLILWDGIKMYQSGHFFGLISAFNPFFTKEVTLHKNGSSAIYGDGVSGVISMSGDSKINNKFNAGWGINLISTDFFLDVPVGKKASVQISGRKSINNIVKTPTYDSYFEKAFQNTEVLTNNEIQSNSNDDFSFYDTNLRLLFQPSEKDMLRLNFLLLGNQLEFIENASVNNISLSRKSDLMQNNLSGGIYYERAWNEEFSTHVQVYGSGYELQATNFDIINDQRLIQENQVIDTGLKISSVLSFSENFSTQIGYQFNETGITNFEQLNNPFFEKTDTQVLRTNSLFSEFSYRPFQNNTLIKAGLRLNHINKFNQVLWEPRLSLNHRFWNFFTFEVLGELKSQTTSQIIDFQNDFLGVENRRWVLSSPENIPILKGQQLSIGLTYEHNGLLLNIEPYIKKVTGITAQSQGFQNQFQESRTYGSYMVKGVDVLINKRIKDFTTWLSYSFANNDYTFKSLSITEFPNNIDIRHSLTYGANYSWRDFKISGGLNWHSGKPTTSVIQPNSIIDGEINFNNPNADNVKDYVRVDVSCTYWFNLGEKVKAFAGISIWNLLGTENVVNNFYRIGAEDRIERIDEFALKFTPNASFRLQF